MVGQRISIAEHVARIERDFSEVLRIAKRIEIGLERIANEATSESQFLLKALEFIDESFALPPSDAGGG